MRKLPCRRALPHFEIMGGVAHVTWRLRSAHPALDPDEREIVKATIQRDQNVRCQVIAGVVMDDHIHILFRPHPHFTSMELVAVWKSISSHRICATPHRTAPLWQRDSYQRWMRSDEQTAICAAYIRTNPFRRWPGILSYPWLLP